MPSALPLGEFRGGISAHRGGARTAWRAFARKRGGHRMENGFAPGEEGPILRGFGARRLCPEDAHPMNPSSAHGPSLRHKRMTVDSACLMIRGEESYTSEVMDISSTGVMVRRPVDWLGQRGDRFVLDMLFGDDLNIHVEAVVARVGDDEVGFAFAAIPPDKEQPLWNLLGAAADSLERFQG
ncbi:MAG: PilZ domain-containing protein [Xanthomonadales bacterium]|nr:PilZ domain-containing protein [Xanthomonadales bacterium]